MNKFSHAISALSHSTHPSKRLIFPDIYNDSWFKENENLKIEQIEHRKEFEWPFFHEFILVRFSDGSQYRFDRRPDPMQPMDAWRRGSNAHDTVQLVQNIEDLDHAPSECIAALDFKDHCVAGLSLILAVCAAISRDKKASLYTLREFNCYFFSWTIIATVARSCVAWESAPYDSHSLYLPEDRLSQTMAHGIMTELSKSLPQSLSTALLSTLPRMLTINVPEIITMPLGSIDVYSDFSQQLNLSLNAESFKRRLCQIIQKQYQVIVQTLNNPSNREELQKTIKSLVLQANPENFIEREDLGMLLRGFLWQSEVISTLSLRMGDQTRQWCTPDNTDHIVGGQIMWDFASNLIKNWIGTDIQKSASSQIAEHIGRIVGDTLGAASHQTGALNQAIDTPMISSIRNIVDASIEEITDYSVCHALGRVRQHVKVTHTAILDSISHAVDNLFPDELPIGLRIPKTQSFRLRQLLWLARPKSALCLWRTSWGIQNCELVKHQALQKYLSRRIYAHSRDVRLLEERSSGERVQMTIREAMSRVWVAVSVEIGGPRAHLKAEVHTWHGTRPASSNVQPRHSNVIFGTPVREPLVTRETKQDNRGYIIRNVALPNVVLELAAGSAHEYTPVLSCHRSDEQSQVWIIEQNGDMATFQNAQSGTFVGAPGIVKNGSPAVAAFQPTLFQIRPANEGFIIAPITNLHSALTLPAESDGHNCTVHYFKHGGGPDQQWYIERPQPKPTKVIIWSSRDRPMTIPPGSRTGQGSLSKLLNSLL